MPLDESQNSHTQATDWPEIDRSLLGEVRPPPVAFPLHLLPEPWRAWVEAAARPFGSPDYLAHCLLGAAAGVCGGGLWVRVTTQWAEPLLLWQALVGGPSSGKSASFARVRELLEEVKPWKESDDSKAPAVLVDAALDRVEPGLWRSSRGVLVWRDDLAGWMDEARRRKERPAWLAAWQSGPGRIGGSAVDILPVGLLGALRPAELAPGFVDGDSALAARILYAWPETGGPRSLSGAAADDSGVIVLLQRIADFAGHRETPGSIPFAPEAVARLEELMAEMQRAAREREADGVEGEWIAKGPATVVRLSGLLSMMEWALEGGRGDDWGVRLAHLEAAHALWSGYYLPQAMSVFDRAGVSGCELAARRTAGWLKRVRATEISREQVRRDALCQTVNAQGAEDVLVRLEQGGLVRLVETQTPGRTRRRWTVNPALR